MGILEITAPTFEWLELSPLLTVLIGAVLGVVVEGLVPRAYRNLLQVAILVVTIFTAAGLLIVNWISARLGIFAMGALVLDGPAYVTWAAELLFGGLAILIFAERRAGQGASVFVAAAATVPGSKDERLANSIGREHTEVYSLALFSLSGMMVFAASNDLITMFIALEVMSLPLYLLSALARYRRLLSQEAALKYFLLGSFASAFFLFGIGLVYGFSGSLTLEGISSSITLSGTGRGLLLAGIVLLAVGLLFKIGAVPFQSWVPDVYTGAPTPVTGFMAIGVKFAAVMGLARVFFVALGGERWSWQPVLAVIAVLTMAVGAVLALTQTNIKRLLAYSAVSHAGFVLTAVVGANAFVPDGQINALGAISFYLIAYGFATVAAFGIVTLVRKGAGETLELGDWAGLGVREPVLAGAFAVALLSFAGIPLTAGFIGKWAVFSSAWSGGYAWLSIVGVGFSLIAAYLYLKVLVSMFFADPASSVSAVKPSLATWIPVIVGAIGSLVFGLFPGPLMDLLSHAEVFLR
ncbi:MAG: NADH-quinone oxidoreductase subunit NuoN [Propionibacteriaceae bacterium]|jgi:NADH-quinone oxidoreductase subunit N|nr:NADH-quinone oxidoreductase subunit NuoN [Propionibacteriaceae bacterium]